MVAVPLRVLTWSRLLISPRNTKYRKSAERSMENENVGSAFEVDLSSANNKLNYLGRSIDEALDLREENRRESVIKLRPKLKKHSLKCLHLVSVSFCVLCVCMPQASIEHYSKVPRLTLETCHLFSLLVACSPCSILLESYQLHLSLLRQDGF